MINKRIIILILGVLLLIEAFFLFVSGIVAIAYQGTDANSFFISGGVTLLFGSIAYFFNRKASKNIGKREGFLIVSLVWVVFSLFGSLPFVLSGEIPSYTDAFFETISGFTTTGASILNDIESMSMGLLFWRSLTQWLGGMGIIVLSLSILPFLGIGGMQLFSAEVPGLTPDKLHPKVKETAKRLWAIYSLFTVAEVILLVIGGMGWFDAVNHSFTTMATGGYSTKQASIAHFDSPFIHYVIIAFMFLAGMNFSLSYFALHGKVSKIMKNEEFRYYLWFVIAFTFFIGFGLWITETYGFEQSFRDAMFQVVSIITTTGFATNDYLLWAPALTFAIFVLMFFGGSSGSTGGGIKIVRIVVVIKNSYYEVKRLMHPKAIIPVRLNRKVMTDKLVMNVLAFIVFYFIIFVMGVALMSLLGLDLKTAMGAVAATLGNIGPGIGDVGPSDNFAFIHDAGKWVLSFLMLLGRLELFTVLAILTPVFWRK
jgi:trk system potassium uptake protein TrkH